MITDQEEGCNEEEEEEEEEEESEESHQAGGRGCLFRLCSIEE